jgi:ribosome-associated protein
MRGRDPETGEFLAPSRSQRKREAEAVLDLAEQLVALTPQALGKLPLPEHLRDAVRDTQRISSHIARKRQLHYLAKQMRREDDALLDELRAQLGHDRNEARRETAELHRIESWRDRLLRDGDAALGELADAHPDLDRHHLRQLVRTAHDERLHNRPPKAFRELFRELKTLLAPAAAAARDESE